MSGHFSAPLGSPPAQQPAHSPLPSADTPTADATVWTAPPIPGWNPPGLRPVPAPVAVAESPAVAPRRGGTVPEADVRQLFAHAFTAAVLPAVVGHHADGSALHKIPSIDGHRVRGWPAKQTTPAEAQHVAVDPSLNMLLRLDALRVVDIDIPDPVQADRVHALLAQQLGATPATLPVRYREDTGKRSVFVRVDGNRHMQKAVLTVGATEASPKGAGNVEFLGPKQQSLVCGRHENGSLYYWRGLDPRRGVEAFPLVTETQLLAFYAALASEPGGKVVGSHSLAFGASPERFDAVAVGGDDSLIAFASAHGWIDGSTDRGFALRCPWQSGHTDGARGDPSSTVLLPPAQGSDGTCKPSRFVCQHASCSGRTTRQFANAIGFTGPLPGDKGTPADASPFTAAQAPPGALEAQMRGERAAFDAMQQAIAMAQLSAMATPDPARYKLLGRADLLSMKPTRWAVRDVLPDTGIATIYGASGSGKSFLSWDMLSAVAAGAGEWMGHRIRCAMPVVYVTLEGVGGLPMRVAAMEKHKGQPLPDALNVITSPVHLTNPAHVRDLVAALKEQGYRDGIIAIDTLNRATPGADENSGRDMTAVMEAAMYIQRELGGLVLFIAHSGKDDTKGMRGHSSQFATMDSVIEVRREDEAGDLRSWRVTKSKDGEDGAQQFFRLHSVALGADDEGLPNSSAVVVNAQAPDRAARKSLGNSAALALSTLTEVLQLPGVAAARGAHLEDWRAAFYTQSTGDNTGTKQRTFLRARQDLVTAGRVVVLDDYYRLSGPPDVSAPPQVGPFTAIPPPPPAGPPLPRNPPAQNGDAT